MIGALAIGTRRLGTSGSSHDPRPRRQPNAPKLRPRLSPSTAIATVALVIATSGTAIAAGEIITEPSQIANRVVTHPKLAYESVDGYNLVDGRVGTQDLAHPTYGLKVDANGEDSSREIVTKRITYGRYEVTIPGRNLERCAVVATPRQRSTPRRVPNNLTGSSPCRTRRRSGWTP